MTPTEFIRSLHHATPEKALVGFFKVKAMSDEPKLVDLRLPFFDHKLDTVAYEMALPHGRADIVIFHLDGSTTVIEAKDGANGYTHIAQGIGQLAFYATQLALKGKIKRVRKALMWSSPGDREIDAMITVTCLKAGVIPLEMAPVRTYLAALTVRPHDEEV